MAPPYPRRDGRARGPALAAIVELGIPDYLDKARTAAELAAATGADEDAVDRLCSYFAARGCMKRDRRGRYRASGVTKLLRDEDWQGWVRFVASPWSYAAIAHLPTRAASSRSCSRSIDIYEAA